MKKSSLCAVLIGVVSASLGLVGAQTGESSVVRLDPALDALVSADARVVPVTKGPGFNTKEHRPGPGSFGFTEGLVWLQQGNTGNLFFSDIPANKVYKMTADGQTS